MHQGPYIRMFEDEDGERVSKRILSEIALAHELFHVGSYQKAKFFQPYCNWICNLTGGPWELPDSAIELVALKYANLIRLDKTTGYVRTYYDFNDFLKEDSYKKAHERWRKE